MKALEVDSGESGCVSSVSGDNRQLRVSTVEAAFHLRQHH